MKPAKQTSSKKAAPKKAAPKKAAPKKAAPKKAAPTQGALAKKPRVFAMSFASVYPLYVQKAEKKGRTRKEVDEIIAWLTGYSGEVLQRAIDAKVDLESFFARAPRRPAAPGHRYSRNADPAQTDRGEI